MSQRPPHKMPKGKRKQAKKRKVVVGAVLATAEKQKPNEEIRDMIGEHILTAILRQDKQPLTGREEALKDIILKKLQDKLSPGDINMDEVMKAVTELISLYVEDVTGTVELEYGEKTAAVHSTPIAQHGKGPVFNVNKEDTELNCQVVTHPDAKVVVNVGRGLPSPRKVVLTPGAFQGKECKDWTLWADQVANMGERWTRWIETTVSDSIKLAENKDGSGKRKWEDWKNAAEIEALELRRNRKLIEAQAALFKSKAESTKGKK